MIHYILLFLSVFIGYGIATLINARKSNKWLPVIMAFSGSFLLSVTVFELLPEVYHNSTNKIIGGFIMIGVLLQIILEFFSKGAEHGHVHIHSNTEAFPWLLFVSLSIHALIEGFPINHGNHILTAVIIHKIPITIILSLFFFKANYKPILILVFMTLFAVMTPLGNWASQHITVLQQYKPEITALAIGVILHVSTTILFESSKNHTFNLSKMTAVIIAVGLAFLL